MIISIRHVNELTGEQAKQCRSLTLRENGLMRSRLTYERARKNSTAHAILVHENDLMVGWGLMFRRPWFDFDNGDIDVIALYMYIRHSHRRMGIGTAIFYSADKWAKKKDMSLLVYPHDERAISFYAGKIDNKTVLDGES